MICIECEAVADEPATGWEGHLVDLNDGAQDEIVFYCLRCAEREFRFDPSRSEDLWLLSLP